MKEFVSQTGGRYTYIDDIMNLQELSLAFASIFDGCDNFVVSGCQVSGSTLSAGYVYINGKIRYCAGLSGISTFPVYIYESNSVESVSYADSSDKIGRNIYGCAVASTVPTTKDTLTDALPQSIRVSSDGTALRLKDAFFGKYALMVDSPYSAQSVKNNVEFEDNVTVDGTFTAQKQYISSGSANASIYYNSNGSLIIQSQPTASNKYQLIINSEGDFHFVKNNTTIATVCADGVNLMVSLNANLIYGGNIAIRNGNIFNSGNMTDTGDLNINMVGYNGGVTKYRNTFIGNGKGEAVLSITGSTKSSVFTGSVAIENADDYGITLKHNGLAKTDKTLLHSVAWKDKNDAVIATAGYISNADYDWYIHNEIGNVVVSNDVYVTGKLYVGGVELLSAMVGNSDFSAALSAKANTADVYSKTDADGRYFKKTDSVSSIISTLGGVSTVRNAINAVQTSDLDGYVQKSMLFQDIVQYGLPSTSDSSYTSSLETRKKALCEAIGAAYASDVQTNSQKDTGWLTMNVQNCGIVTEVYVRQVGHVVSIQGQLHTHHSGTIFTLPNSIDPPTYEIGYSHNKDGKWHCTILGGSRDCKVDYCSNGCSEYIGFLMTYIV